MLKQRLLAVVIALVLMTAATGMAGVVGDALGFAVTTPAMACDNPGSSGGC
jgi:hypothetical protein